MNRIDRYYLTRGGLLPRPWQVVYLPAAPGSLSRVLGEHRTREAARAHLRHIKAERGAK
jgi:hypothetical protein